MKEFRTEKFVGTIRVRPETLERLKLYCRKRDLKMTLVADRLLNDALSLMESNNMKKVRRIYIRGKGCQ